MTFQELNLSPAVLRAVREMGYAAPTPIQAAAIGPVMAGRDLIGCAQTGTGKTAAFAIPILEGLQPRVTKAHKPIRALVLTPTRELALQIKENFDQYGTYLNIRNAVIFGGVGQGPQVEALERGVDVLIATPGRLNDLCNQGHIDLSRLEVFVLDEADRMLDMGFIHDVRKVIARLPQKRQTLLFSATMPQEIAELSKTILRNPVRVEVTPQSSTVEAICQQVYRVDKGNKRELLLHLLRKGDYQSVLVFTNTKHGANRVAEWLTKAGIPAMAIHGNKSQNARVAALESFKAGTIRVLVATDIAARGIDVNELACVVNYELPNVPETYVHRIGRTGRAGRSGIAISFCNIDEEPYLRDIEKLIGKKLPLVEDHPWPMEIFTLTPKQPRGQRPAVRERTEEKAGKPAPAPASKPQKQSGSKPEPHPAPAAKPQKQPAAKPEPRPAPAAKPQKQPAAKPEPRPAPAAKPQKQPAAKPEPRPAPVPAAKPGRHPVRPEPLEITLSKPLPEEREAPREKLKLEPLPAPTPAPAPVKSPRRALRSDPWVPGRVVAFADGRRHKKPKQP